MFKKLKDKLAEEVKSSPQRIQQFAQAAQAAVTSASSSISDVTNSDLFSIGGENDNQTNRAIKDSTSGNGSSSFQDVSLSQTPAMTGSESINFLSGLDMMENQRQRRLSNSSLASDVSFRLPSYESPTMYHLQSDMEVSASEAEERSFTSGAVSLDRVTKEQLYAAYRRTQDRYTKYRNQYADLARHYKLLERENAKAKSVLVETQDKALRRISELREQCALEQSAKAHLEKSLRIEMEEKSMKIEALTTQISLIQSNDFGSGDNHNTLPLKAMPEIENDNQLIDLTNDNLKPVHDVLISNDSVLNSKIEKLEQLVNKYKESLKSVKEKNGQMTTELQILSSDLDNTRKEKEQLKKSVSELSEALQKIEELNNLNEELQNKINSYDFNKSKAVSTLEIDLQKSQEEIAHLQSKINVFGKREEEYAISLAENKLSIHKELESKEKEIKSLKDSLSVSRTELQSVNIIVDNYKSQMSSLDDEIEELNTYKSKVSDLEMKVHSLTQTQHSLEQVKAKKEEELNCLQIERKQETAEKLALIDRNSYLENRISNLVEDNSKKCNQISELEKKIVVFTDKEQEFRINISEAELWKSKYTGLENEMQEEREELIKLQTEIEKLLANHESLQKQNLDLHHDLEKAQEEKVCLRKRFESNSNKINNEIKIIKNNLNNMSEIMHLLKNEVKIIPDIISKLEEFNLNQQSNFNIATKQQNVDLNKMDNLITRNSALSESLDTCKLKIEMLEKEIQNVKEKHTSFIEEANIVTNEKEKLSIKLKEVQSAHECLQKSVDHDKSQYLTALDKLKLLEDEKQTLQKRFSNTEKENEMLNTEIEKLKVLHKDVTSKLNVLNEEKVIIKEKDSHIENLEQKIHLLSQENMSLKNQSEQIASSVKSLEVELNEVRQSHADMEIEKDRLNSCIEILEQRERNDESQRNENNTQTDFEFQSNRDEMPSNPADSHDSSTEPGNNISDNSKDLPCLQNNNNENNVGDKISLEKYKAVCNDYEVLKEDNRRLQSDIEGLQTYLSKISKENSLLNDKLRELIASSEHSSEHKLHDLDSELPDLKNATDNDKIQELIRDNALLVEENLELKDQLRSQNYVEPKIKSNDESSDKYNELSIANSKLEEKLVNLEQMNNTMNGNMQLVQNSNDKLRLTNEKLERRLDEALVSLRHLHSLQENTELEYLRNILYEYLTGSGTHSITLAKVLAAVVKFDVKQTENIIQKEKERQGVLRQLGLL